MWNHVLTFKCVPFFVLHELQCRHVVSSSLIHKKWVPDRTRWLCILVMLYTYNALLLWELRCVLSGNRSESILELTINSRIELTSCVTQNRSLHVVIGANANRTVEFIFYDPGRKVLDSTIWFECPGKIGERGVRNTWIPQCHIHYSNVALRIYAIFSMYYSIWNLWFKTRICLCNTNLTKNGKHVNIWAWFYMCICVRTDDWIQNFTTGSKYSGFNHPIRVSTQAFSRKIGQQVRGVSETHGYHNVAYTFRFACRIYGISALGIAWHSQSQPALHCRL